MPAGQEMAPLDEKAQFMRRWLSDLPPIDESAIAQVIGADDDSLRARNDEERSGRISTQHLESNDDDDDKDGSSDGDGHRDKKNKKHNSSSHSIWISTQTLPITTTAMVGPPVSTTTNMRTLTVTPVISTMKPSVVDVTSIILSTAVATRTTWVSVPIMTTTPLPEITSQPRKGIDPATSTTSATAVPQYSNDQDGDDYDRRPHRNSSGLDETGEHVLIAAGSIGAFILVCFVSWIIYRTLKKTKNSRYQDSADGFWNKIRSPKSPDNERGDMNSMQNAGYYGNEKMQPMPGALMRSNTGHSQHSQRSLLQQPMAPGSVVMIPAEEYASLTKNQAMTLSDYSNNNPTFTLSDYNNAPTLTLSDYNNSSLRSRMPDAYFNQSELARQPSDAFDPAQRQAYRASDLSSLSSGFGDGDILVPESALTPPPPPPVTQPAPAPAPAGRFSAAGRFSWMSRRAGDRETVYTTTSEDRPAKYRSVNSWVNQQIGRIKRADERKQGEQEAPPLPDPPLQAQGRNTLTPPEAR